MLWKSLRKLRVCVMPANPGYYLLMEAPLKDHKYHWQVVRAAKAVEFKCTVQDTSQGIDGIEPFESIAKVHPMLRFATLEAASNYCADSGWQRVSPAVLTLKSPGLIETFTLRESFSLDVRVTLYSTEFTPDNKVETLQEDLFTKD